MVITLLHLLKYLEKELVKLTRVGQHPDVPSVRKKCAFGHGKSRYYLNSVKPAEQ